MKATDVVLGSLEEDSGYIKRTVEGLTSKELAWSPAPHSNSIMFLYWHVTRGEDMWINRALLGGKDIYESGGWFKKFGTPAQDTGFGYDIAKLKSWPMPSLQLMQEYAAAVRAGTVAYLKKLTEKQLEEPKDFGFMKGTVGTALTHVVSEVGEHTGQIAYVRGIIKGITPEVPPEK